MEPLFLSELPELAWTRNHSRSQEWIRPSEAHRNLRSMHPQVPKPERPMILPPKRWRLRLLLLCLPFCFTFQLHGSLGSQTLYRDRSGRRGRPCRLRRWDRRTCWSRCGRRWRCSLPQKCGVLLRVLLDCRESLRIVDRRLLS